MAPGEQIALQPRLAGVLGENLEHASAMRADVLGAVVAFNAPLVVSLRGRREDAVELIAHQLVRAEKAEVARVLRDDFGEVFREHADGADLRLAAFFFAHFDSTFCERWKLRWLAHASAEGVRIATHAPLAFRTTCEDIRVRRAVFIKEFLGPIRPQPIVHNSQMAQDSPSRL